MLLLSVELCSCLAVESASPLLVAGVPAAPSLVEVSPGHLAAAAPAAASALLLLVGPRVALPHLAPHAALEHLPALAAAAAPAALLPLHRAPLAAHHHAPAAHHGLGHHLASHA